MITTGLHVDCVAATLHDHDVFDAGRVGESFVGRRLEREHLTTSVAAVGGDENLGFGVVDAIGEGL